MGQLNYREVTGFFTARIPDSGDADLNPDTVPLTGNVTFHPEYRKPLVFPGEHIVLEPINAIIIDGQLMVEVIQNEDVVLQALHLPVTMDERANQTWSWTMRFHGMTLGQYGETVELPDVRFVIEEGVGPLDLSTVPQTTARASSSFITRGPRGHTVSDVRSVDGDLVFEWEDGNTANVPLPVEDVADAIAARNVVQAADVRRILASTNVEEPLDDGDLLIVLESPRLFTDFSSYATGFAPFDWQNRWDTSGTWSVEADTGGGKVLRCTTESTARRALTWDAAADLESEHADVELVFKSRSASLTEHGRSILRGGGEPGAEDGYYAAFWSTSRPFTGAYLNGTTSSGDNQSGDVLSFTPDAWYITRFRVHGTNRMVKIWPSGQPEPQEWSVTGVADHITTPGFIALSVWGGPCDFDWVGMAFDGGRAPMGDG